MAGNLYKAEETAPRTPAHHHFIMTLGDKNVNGEGQWSANWIISLSFILGDDISCGDRSRCWVPAKMDVCDHQFFPLHAHMKIALWFVAVAIICKACHCLQLIVSPKHCRKRAVPFPVAVHQIDVSTKLITLDHSLYWETFVQTITLSLDFCLASLTFPWCYR